MPAAATWDFLFKVSPGSNVNQLSVTGIPNTYTDLFIIGMWDSTEGANGMRLRVNENTSSVYYQNQLFYAPTLQGTSSQLDNVLQTWITNGGTVTGKQGSIWQILNYTSSNDKALIWHGVNYDANGVDFQTGIIATSSAVSSIQFRNTGGDSSNQLTPDAVFYIYGIKAA